MASLASPPWVWLVGSLFIWTALFWPYLIMSDDSVRDAVRRTPQVAVACLGVASAATLTPSVGWAWLTVGAVITIAIIQELWLRIDELRNFEYVFNDYKILVIAGLITGVVGTASFARTPSWAWLAAAVLTATVTFGEVWDHLSYLSQGLPEEKVKFVAGTAVLTAAVAFATVHLPLLWVWIATPVLVIWLNWDRSVGRTFGLKSAPIEPGWPHRRI